MCLEKEETPVRWLEQYGDYLYAFAVSRLHDAAAAEDVVQETLLSAFETRRSFAEKSSAKTWLTAILKHKIIDHFRRASRRVVTKADDNDFFDASGGWHEAPADWNAGTPESMLERRELQAILRSALAALPKNLAAVFTLSEIEGLAAREICEILSISPNNFWVLLHRARLQLRHAIESQWFGINARPKTMNQREEFIFSI